MSAPGAVRSAWVAVYLSEFRAQVPNLIGLIGLLHIFPLLSIPMVLIAGPYSDKIKETLLAPYWQNWLSPYGTDLNIAGLFVMWVGLDLFAKDWRERTVVFLRSIPVSETVTVTAKLAAGFSVVSMAVAMAIPIRSLGVSILGGDVSIREPLAALPVALLLTLPWLLAGAILSCHMQRIWVLILIGVAIWFGVLWAISEGSLKAVGFYLAGTDPVRLVLIHLLVALAFGGWVVRATKRRQFL